jgi:acyl carrier protein
MLDGVSLEARVTGLIHGILVERSKRSVFADDNLRDVGFTSLDMVSLVLQVEAEFDINIPEVDITPGNFRSIRAITVMIATLLS